jgi:hypothetical protein
VWIFLTPHAKAVLSEAEMLDYPGSCVMRDA